MSFENFPRTTHEQVSTHPGYKAAMELIDMIDSTFKPGLIGKGFLTVRDSNPNAPALMDLANSLKKGDFSKNEPDLKHLTSISHKKDVITFHYEDNPDLDFQYKKGEKEYDAIFWRKLKAEKKIQKAFFDERKEMAGEIDVAKQEKTEKKESVELYYDKEIFVDEVTGYKIALFVPKNFDGSIDLYFPGGGVDLDNSLQDLKLREKFLQKVKKGEKSGFAIIEGNKEALLTGKNRFAKLNNPDYFEAMVNSIEIKMDEGVKNIHLISSGKSAETLNSIIGSGDLAANVEHISFLDSSTETAYPLVAFAKRGGRIDLVFKAGSETEGPAKKLIEELGLKKIASRYWQSKDGKVNVYEETKMSKEEIPKNYIGAFIGSDEGVKIEAAYGDPNSTTTRSFEQYVEDNSQEAGKLHSNYFDKLEVISKNEKLVKEDEAKMEKASIEDIRFKSRYLNEKDPKENDEETVKNLKDETARRIKMYTSKYDKGWYTLNYARWGSDEKGRSHEYNIGLGDILLDPDIKEIVVERGGKIIHAVRGVVKKGKHKGRVGFISKKSGKYVYSHTGDRFRILSSNEMGVSDYIKEYNNEETVRTSQKEDFEKEIVYSPKRSKFSHESGYFAGETVEGIDFKVEGYDSFKEEDFHKVKRKGLIKGLKLSKNQKEIPVMGYQQAIKYFERTMGRWWKSPQWLLTKRSFKQPVMFFNKDLRRTRCNAVLACLLIEMEDRVKKIYATKFPGKKLDMNWGYLTTTARNKGFHGFGMAIDFEPQNNWLAQPEKTKWNIPVIIAYELQKMGFGWGMYYYTSRENHDTDAMHFDYKGSLPNAMKQLTSPRAINLAKSFILEQKGTNLYDYCLSLSGKYH